MNTYITKLLSKKELAHHMVELTLEKPSDFDFLSGQFLQIMVPNGEKQTPRAYSICSTPKDEHIVLCIKLHDDGLASNYLRNMPDGSDMTIKGPAGHFTLSEDVPLLCVATGTGIAPVISLIRDHLEHKKTEKQIHLIFGVRSQQDLFWQKRFQKLADTYTNFKYDITLSRPEDGWDGLNGRVTAHIPHIDASTHAYLCGSAEMVQEVRKMLLNKDVEAGRIHFEIF